MNFNNTDNSMDEIYSNQDTLLKQAIIDRQWGRVESIVKENPNSTRTWGFVQCFMDSTEPSHILPIHLALSDQDTPLNIIHLLIDAYPESIFEVESRHLRNCVHVALRGMASEIVISFIIQHFPKACEHRDKLGRVALHYAIHNGCSVSLVKEIINAYPEAVKLWDNFHWCPLHIACQSSSRCSPELVMLLLVMSPDVIMKRTGRGSTPLDMARGSMSPQRNMILPILEGIHATFRDLPGIRNYLSRLHF